MTIQDALVAYRTYARAEGKSPKTISWVVSSVGYFAEFLSPDQQDISTITGNDLRRFIIALQEKPKFSNHPYNKPQTARTTAHMTHTFIYVFILQTLLDIIYSLLYTEFNYIIKPIMKIT